MTSATERLRAMLDDCGVEWWQSANTLGCIFTRWYSPIFGDEVVAMENGEEGLVLFDHFLTPEQAIAATLGEGECTLEFTNAYWDPYVRTAYVIELSCHTLDAWDDPVPPSYCPYCGKRVVKEDA